ncbi:MAG TPA: hypothetical protein VFH63_07835 [candidate division Zixibacteria bacterium]|nr:hypothetical protein [candidate division Zixibacteria bacterium]
MTAAISRISTRPTGARALGIALTVAILGLTLTTAYVHLGLGGLLFTLNGLGYAGLAAIYVLGASAPHPLIAVFGWAPRVALAGYAALTIAAWAVQGPYFDLAYFTKAVEATLIALVIVDIHRVYGSVPAMVRTAFASILGAASRT